MARAELAEVARPPILLQMTESSAAQPTAETKPAAGESLTQTTGQWLKAWLNSDDHTKIASGKRGQYALLLDAVLVECRFGNSQLATVGSAQLHDFYRKKLRKTLPHAVADLIYGYAHFALRAAAKQGRAKADLDFDARWVAHLVAKTVRQTMVSLLGILILLGGGFLANSAIIAARDGEDLVGTVVTQARELGLGPVVATIENFYYQYIERPVVGGTPSEAANFGGATAASSPTPSTSYKPATIANEPQWGVASPASTLPPQVSTPAQTPMPDEGIWEPTKIQVNGSTAVYVARIRPDDVHTSYYANLVWFDPKQLAFEQIPGTHVPEGNYDHGTGQVALDRRPYYVAGLADAFLLGDSQGGYMLGDKVIRKMVDGRATLVTYTDGSIDVVQWGRDPVRSNIQAARQNLSLNVDGGVSQVLSETQNKWGWVWHGVGSGGNLVWRSAIGVRADGTVVYCVGNWLSAKSLADMMVRAGAVRSMILDMNSGYANGYFYGPYPGGQKIDPTIPREVTRFWNPSTRDFIAVFMKSPAN